MFSVRALARLAPLAARTAVAIPRVAQPAAALRIAATPASRAFSSSRMTWNKVDQELIAKLDDEIKCEAETEAETPEPVSDYLKKSPFQLTEKSGSDEVILTRKFGNEEIKVVFAVSDINAAEDEDDLEYAEDYDEEGNQQQNQQQEQSQEGEEEEEGEAESLTFPVRCLITISKSNAGSISVEAIAQDGAFIVESVANIKDNVLANSRSVEADWEKRGLYQGPPFAELDERLQVAFEQYLEERGINSDLAWFVPNYVFHKDQLEYTNWLKDFKAFVAAK
ncbi:hypothetical protein DFQ27_004742 [Actinomortierella ambigua]|uniref:Mitochondrial glyco protein n=1 Tax=Actinomortierella ambigua TaxID=1343610 RepID=A0A9P6Q2C0_9FUNG|nr:hypothetical protein DFQ27_004742 [Actinomortierella ambigua]